MERKALFIINPISGGKKKDGVPELIEKHLDTNLFRPVIVFSDGVSHARQIAKEAVDKFDLIVAVGGDGTVNEVASAIVGSNTTLGIVPFGSGNGLSRFLGIPMDAQKAIETLGTGNAITIDSGKLNGQPFFNMAGMGFDAHISEVFSHTKKRGFFSYIKTSIQEVAKYKPQTYHIEIDGKTYEREAFMLSFANSSQYGNDAHISPNASVQDGLLDVCVIKRFPLWRFVELSIRMMTKTTDSSRYVEIIKGKHINVKRNSPGPLHLDGEPQMGGADAEIVLVPNSLKVIAGSTFK
ncbi:diacylglycerol/lipid kinase family protein [Mucilaginibacter xinganensis]|uniref:Diacylglycerol kinase n=1 Tax=Mucilaginibacter xinganensis TaxID=1234841 RepID=A0A223P1W9_9SPHI|nr:diacylglycerol kinase family protein [Mucilaginibacter xinganensis]ASU36112.1 diacylglycerol kinase [Mucilaginibacter xinganensis]